MKFDQHNELEALRADVSNLAAKLQSALEAHRKRMAELSSEQARKQFAPAFLAQKINEERARARKVEADHREAIAEVKQRIENAANFWSTEARLRNARLVEGNGPERELLAELRHMRLAAEFRAARPDELAGYIREAGERSDLAQLEMLRREVKRREFATEAERLPLSLAISEAIAGVKIEGQEQARAIIEGALEQFSVASDYASELKSGQVATGTRMRAAMKKYFPEAEQEA
jgi:hypothetical protein